MIIFKKNKFISSYPIQYITPKETEVCVQDEGKALQLVTYGNYENQDSYHRFKSYSKMKMSAFPH